MRLYEVLSRRNFIAENEAIASNADLHNFAAGILDDLIENPDFRESVSGLVRKNAATMLGKRFDKEEKEFIISRVQEWVSIKLMELLW